MKLTTKLILLFIAVTTLQSCCWHGDCNGSDDLPAPIIESQFEPVYMERPAFESSVNLSSAKPVVDAGKIYVIADYLFINEKNEGFHVYNNENPSNPTPIYFIESPGATDLAIRENVCYINQATDLIAIEINLETGLLNLSKRIKNTFPVMLSPDGFYPVDIPQNSVVVNWIPKTNNP
ncbi:hypothetical protein QRD02_04925 [Aequorivita sp. SDUM287046]|uniref:LVIVD repeat-containing protein n=1 Tax=Aequorivita aurantiaca TaxID=3053356 RepID=A0ABT8DIH6_9FLAO|nr:hypothetical protein [Aequorivita aurantiaca]MDN3723715.1 hypothetical protein [Aequorivita aurantiaca]